MFNFTEKTAGNPTTATMVFLSMLLTGFGIYDHIGQYAGAGSAVPVTGFGNSVVSAAIEHRTEGYVLGVGGNIFKLAGTVIVFGVFSAFVVVLIRTVIMMWGDRNARKIANMDFHEPPGHSFNRCCRGPV